VDDLKQQEYWAEMRGDPRSIDELVTTALTEPDEDIAWNAVVALHFRGTREVLEKAEALCHSICAAERRLGANILGQLGVPERTCPGECVSVLLGMLDHEVDADVLQAVFVALSHLGDADAIGPALRYQGHSDPEVRHGVVLALTGYEDQRAVDTLIELSHDQDAHVRDWATFALGQQIAFDTPVIRETLADRLTDSDYETRCEAIMGLALRGDRRVIPSISKELVSDSVGCSVVEAAAIIPDPDFYPLLLGLRDIALQESSDASNDSTKMWQIAKIDEAIEACRPSVPCDEQQKIDG
jgi:HEAT repeat protein